MAKERFMAIFIGVIMVGSIAGFAIANLDMFSGGNKQNPQLTPIMNRSLTTEERIFVLRAGRVLVENLYSLNCTDCTERNSAILSFADKFKDSLVLEQAAVEYNQTKFQMIGAEGKIRDLQNESLDYDNLLKVFCGIAVVQPRECLLMEI
jgi:hypothetical protein